MADITNSPSEVVAALLAEQRLTAAEIDGRLANACDPAYWTAIAPSLSIAGTGAAAAAEQSALDDATLHDIVRNVRDEGFFQAGSLLAPPYVTRMREAIERLRAADWPPVFAFVFDEFWQVTRTPSIVRLLTGILGPRFRQNAGVWCHYVSATGGAGGWRPHVDGPDKPDRFSIWLPITDATLDNGCMYVVRGDRLPASLRTVSDEMNFQWRDVRAALQGARALPAAVGSVLGWRFDIMHWGSVSKRASHPRVSMAVEFAPESAPVQDSEQPIVVGAGTPPSFHQRLQCIAQSIRIYEQHEPRMGRFTELARQLWTVSG